MLKMQTVGEAANFLYRLVLAAYGASETAGEHNAKQLEQNNTAIRIKVIDMINYCKHDTTSRVK